MLNNKEERKRFLNSMGAWELIHSIEELDVAYFRVKSIPCIVKRMFMTTWINDTSEKPHVKVEYYIYDETKKTLTATCLSELLEKLKNMKEGE